MCDSEDPTEELLKLVRLIPSVTNEDTVSLNKQPQHVGLDLFAFTLPYILD
jgi:hypothetical protein